MASSVPAQGLFFSGSGNNPGACFDPVQRLEGGRAGGGGVAGAGAVGEGGAVTVAVAGGGKIAVAVAGAVGRGGAVAVAVAGGGKVAVAVAGAVGGGGGVAVAGAGFLFSWEEEFNVHSQEPAGNSEPDTNTKVKRRGPFVGCCAVHPLNIAFENSAMGRLPAKTRYQFSLVVRIIYLHIARGR